MPHGGRWAGSPFCRPPTNARSARHQRQSGRLFFGYFLLAENCSCIFGIRHILVACGAKDKSAGSGFGVNPKGKNQGWFLQRGSPSGARTRFNKTSRERFIIIFRLTKSECVTSIINYPPQDTPLCDHYISAYWRYRFW